jgi:hypothetical protein
VRTLVLTILCYSLFTFLGAMATDVWQLAAFRLLAGLGIGGEWTLGGTLVAEVLPEERRKNGAGLLHYSDEFLHRFSEGAVVMIAVGRFEKDQVSVAKRFKFLEDEGTSRAQVAGENHPFLPSLLLHKQLNTRRAKHMAGLSPGGLNSGRD